MTWWRIVPLLCTGVVFGQQALRPVDETAFPQLIGANKGKVVVVDFWATWCAPCREEIPQLVELERKYRSRGLRLVTVSCDEPEQEADARRFLVEKRVPGPLYIKKAADDEKFINFIDRKWSGAPPALFLYDRQGRMVRSFIGEADMAALEKALRSLL